MSSRRSRRKGKIVIRFPLYAITSDIFPLMQVHAPTRKISLTMWKLRRERISFVAITHDDAIFTTSFKSEKLDKNFNASKQYGTITPLLISAFRVKFSVDDSTKCEIKM